MNIVNSDKTDRLIDALVILWEASVRATHHFLTENDIQNLTPLVKMGLSDIETLIIVYDNNKPVAFMGIDAAKIEMLFVSPDYISVKVLVKSWQHLPSYNMEYSMLM